MISNLLIGQNCYLITSVHIKYDISFNLAFIVSYLTFIFARVVRI